MDLGKLGIWWSGSWRWEEDESVSVAAELEALGYTALWSSAGFQPGLPARFERLLASTTAVAVASGIASIWVTPPEDLSRDVADLDARYPGRFLLGLGVSHGPVVADYGRPYAHMVSFLDGLDAAGVVTKDRRILAALGPRMLTLAGTRAAGAHPYFVPVEHTARARQILGQGPILAPEVTVVLERDPSRARAVARTFTAGYLTLPNYVNNLLTLGFDDDDVAGGGSDRLVDAIVGWGDVDAVAARVAAHYDAGADHVCVQVFSDGRTSIPLTEYRELAPALLSL
ncbi:MAG TPA: LLM class F420-dependent oxidoreductase [Acidimicrobiales bacterium]|nr:LLM class F420-dependent oxidoreductase [Acidimicrobiales bacterium]